MREQEARRIGISIAAGEDQSVVLLLAGPSFSALPMAFGCRQCHCTRRNLPGLSPAKAGGAFGLINAVGHPFGFIAPTVGGLLTGLLVKSSGLTDAAARHVFGLCWSLFPFGLVNIIGIIGIVRMGEMGRQRP